MKCHNKDCVKQCDSLEMATCIYRETEEQSLLKLILRADNGWVDGKYYTLQKHVVQAKINTHTGDIFVGGYFYRRGHVYG